MSREGGDRTWAEDEVGSRLGSPLGSAGSASCWSSRVRALLKPMFLTASFDEADEVTWLSLINDLACWLLGCSCSSGKGVGEGDRCVRLDVGTLLGASLGSQKGEDVLEGKEAIEVARVLDVEGGSDVTKGGW